MMRLELKNYCTIQIQNELAQGCDVNPPPAQSYTCHQLFDNVELKQSFVLLENSED